MNGVEKSDLIRHRLKKGRASPFKTYKELTVGDASFAKFLLHEFLSTFVAPIPGGLGYVLRKKTYPLLLKRVGAGLIIGRNVVIRHPSNILLGDNVTIDDNCVIDGRGAGESGVVLEDDVIINRNCLVLAKGGPIEIGKRTTLGSNSVVVSTTGVRIGEAVMTAGNCCLSAGAYRIDGIGAVMDNEFYSKGPITIDEGTWLGTGVIVLDGVHIGSGAVVGAGAVVKNDVPEHGVAVGVPARVVRTRQAVAES